MTAPAYVVFDVTINDAAAMKPYQMQVGDTVAQYGGKTIVLAGEITPLEGEVSVKRQIVLEFPSKTQAEKWYNSPEYQAIVGIRKSASTSHCYIIEGFVE